MTSERRRAVRFADESANSGDGFGRNLPCLAFHILSDTEALKHFGRDVDDAGAVGKGDRFRRGQHAPDRVDGTDVRLRCACAHRDSDARCDEIDLAPVGDLAGLREVIKRRAAHDHEIIRFVRLHAL